MLICKKRKIEDKRYKILKVIILYNKLQDIFNTYNKLIIVKAIDNSEENIFNKYDQPIKRSTMGFASY